MAKVAIMGFGTVGTGVLEILRRNSVSISKRTGDTVDVKYILDIRDFTGHPDEKLFTKDFDQIINDDEVKVLVETIGGLNPAYNFVKKGLEAGRHVVTSNKELVATHGAQLLQTAKDNNVCFLFEASVGGGTPIITPMHQCLVANTLTEVSGIVNGTTNFMLSKMTNDNMSFDQALKIAQDLGYAETTDPSADVDGKDACRKIAILSSLAFGNQVHPQNIPTDGIRKVTIADIKNAASINGAVKLIAWTKKDENTGKVLAGVEAMVVSKNNQLAGVEDVFNAVSMRGDMLGDVVFYGKGAGKLPTASAVVADIIDGLRNGVNIHETLFWAPTDPIDGLIVNDSEFRCYIRVTGASTKEVLSVIPEAQLITDKQGIAVLTNAITVNQLNKIEENLHSIGAEIAISLKLLD